MDSVGPKWTHFINTVHNDSYVCSRLHLGSALQSHLAPYWRAHHSTRYSTTTPLLADTERETCLCLPALPPVRITSHSPQAYIREVLSSLSLSPQLVRPAGEGRGGEGQGGAGEERGGAGEGQGRGEKSAKGLVFSQHLSASLCAANLCSCRRRELQDFQTGNTS